MNTEKLLNCERTKIEKLSRFQLSNKWKTIGGISALVIFLTMVGFKFIDNEPLWLKDVLRKLLLVSFLVIIISKDKIEDEMLKSLRSMAYSLAFIVGVIYALIQPVLDYLIHEVVYKPSSSNGFSYFELLLFMLLMQIMFFEILKRNR